MFRVIAAFVFLSASIPAVLADETKKKDISRSSSATSSAAQGPYGALSQMASEKNKPKAADAFADRLLLLGTTRLEADALNASPQNSSGPLRRSRAFDASEGTPLDPLRNDTFDLSHPHDVPPMK
jgi:hypothetical protein